MAMSWEGPPNFAFVDSWLFLYTFPCSLAVVGWDSKVAFVNEADMSRFRKSKCV